MPSKATKKFQNKKLKGVLEKRKGDAKIKQRKRLTEKKKARRQKDLSSNDGGPTKRSAREKSGKTAATKDLKDMTVDEFFQDGLDIADGLENSKRSPKAGQSANGAQPKIGNRKRSREDDAASIHSDDTDPKEGTFSEPGGGVDSQSEDSIEGHKGDLEALAEKDPDFYKYLKENDAELLDFSDDQELEEPDEPDVSEEPARKKKRADGEEVSASQLEQSSVEVSVPMVEKWEIAMQEQRSLRATKELLLAFRSAAHASDLEEKDYKYSISSPEVYHKVLVVTLKRVPDVLEHHLPVKALANGRIRVPTDSKKYSTLSPVLNAHCSALAHLLGGLSDAATLKLTLTCLLPLIPYFLSFKKSVKALAKVILDVWSDTSNNEATRISAFLLVRRLAVTGDPSIREAVLKSTYQALIRGARSTTIHTLPGINLMKNSAAELWSLDPALGYTTGFTYIRQLAVHLRPAIAKPSADAHRAVYNWQFVHALDFWSRALSTHCSLPTVTRPSDSPLHPLVYPVVQLCLAAARLVPAPHYFPLRFHCARALLRLGRAARVYIPMAPLLLEVLRSPELSKPAKPSTLKPLDFRVALRAPAAYLRTRAYQDGAGEQVVELLAEFFGTWATNVAFPELVLAPSVIARRWLKEASAAAGAPRGQAAGAGKGAKGKGAKRDAGGNRNGRLNAAVSLLLQKLAAHAAHVEGLRRNVNFAPNDRREVENFMRDVQWEDTPLGAYVQGMRARGAEKDKALEEGRRGEEKRRKQQEEGPKDEESERWRDRLEVRVGHLVDNDSDEYDSEGDEADDGGGGDRGMNGGTGEGMGDDSSDRNGDGGDEDDKKDDDEESDETDEDEELDEDVAVEASDEDAADNDEDEPLDDDAVDQNDGDDDENVWEDEEELIETKKTIAGMKRRLEREEEESRRLRDFRDYKPGYSNMRSTSNGHE